LLKSLENRIQATNRYSAPTILAQKQGLLDNKRVELTKYASLLNTPYAAIGKTPFDLVWQRDSLSDLTPPALRETNGMAFPEAVGWNYQSLQERKDMVSTYGAHLRCIAEAGGRIGKKENDWGWLPDGDLSLSNQHRLLASLPLLRVACEKRIEIVESLSRTVLEQATDVTAWLGSVEQWSDSLPKADADHFFEALGVLSGMEERAYVESFLDLLKDFEELLSTLPGGMLLLDSATISQLLAQDSEIRALGLADYSINSLHALLDSFSDTEKHVERAKKAAYELSKGLGVRGSFTLRSVTDLIAARHLVEGAPLNLAHLRGANFAKDGLGHLLQVGQTECAAIIAERNALSENFVVDSPTLASELEEAAAVLESTPWYGRLGKTYRQSVVVFASHCRTGGKRARSQKAACLRYLAQNRRKIDEFTVRADYSSKLGENFSGLTTNWEDLLKVVSWHEAVYARLPEHQAFASEVRIALMTLPATRLKSLLAVDAGSLPRPEELERALELLIALHARVPDLMFDHEDAEVEVFLGRVRVVVSSAAILLKTLETMNLPGATSRLKLIDIANAVEKARIARGRIENDERAKVILGRHFDGAETQSVQLAKTLALVREVSVSTLPKEVTEWLLTSEYQARSEWLRKWTSDFSETGSNLVLGEQAVISALGCEIPFAKRTSIGALRRVISSIEGCLRSQSLLPMWVDAQRSARQLRSAELGYLVALCLDGSIQPGALVCTFEYLVCDSLLRHLFNEYPDLWRLSGVTHQEVRSQFASLDKSVINLNQLDIAHRASRRPIPAGVRGAVVKDTTELALVNHEITKQRKHIPIRQLMLRAGRAIQGLKPCFMMSPMSVAQFLAPGRLAFDLVVMDEASQLRPEDALGAVVRGTQLVVVGDPKQLPPTSFFQRALDDEADESDEVSAVAESESILDIALGRYQPVRRLRWHYRSQHHSLIAFSNSEFYDENLIVFPSAYHDHPELGVKYIDAKGVYENRRNALEAERVVEAILEHILLYPADSLGVVTMNFEQRELIEELLDARLKQDSFSSSWVDQMESTPEPFFVKNLENVQGDERDVIFISITYGPDVQGSYFQRFSGVNTASGQRRLNVLITRAKKRTVLFSSLDPDMIRADANTPWGVRALKGYLHFAKNGISTTPQISPSAEPSNEHEAAVGAVLKEQGYDVVPQVGVSGYFIDLAVRHPEKPGAFLLGIEFDGKSYHSGRSARDRDRLREMTLVNQGWKIHRIWSTDWFKNRNSEVERLLQRVRSLEFVGHPN
jgi:very-short-patch-repair endonuclease